MLVNFSVLDAHGEPQIENPTEEHEQTPETALIAAKVVIIIAVAVSTFILIAAYWILRR